MTYYRKKPVEVEAIRYFQNPAEVLAFTGPTALYGEDQKIYIETLEGIMAANPGDWIIRGVKGELYPCKPDVFAMTYDLVQD